MITRARGDSGGVKRGLGRAEERGHRPVERRGDVHEPRIVGDHLGCASDEQVDRLVERGAPGEVDAGATACPLDPAVTSRVLAPSRTARPGCRARRACRASAAKCRSGPALRRDRIPRRARRPRRAVERRGRISRAWPRAPRGVDREPRVRQGRAQRLARRLRQRGVALDDQGQRRLVERAQVVQQPVAHLAAIAGAHRNARVPRNQRRLEAVGQHDRAVVGGQRLREPPALAQLELAVAEGHGERVAPPPACGG